MSLYLIFLLLCSLFRDSLGLIYLQVYNSRVCQMDIVLLWRNVKQFVSRVLNANFNLIALKLEI